MCPGKHLTVFAKQTLRIAIQKLKTKTMVHFVLLGKSKSMLLFERHEMIPNIKAHITPITKILPVRAMGAGGSHAKYFENQTCHIPRI